MRLSARAAASRENGTLSKGPKTAEGKKRSSINAARHGLLAKSVVISEESREAFDNHHQKFLSKFDPTDGVEHGHVEEMVTASWLMRRLWTIENRLVEHAIANHHDPDPAEQLTLGFKDLARSS
jgi:hypothetical protein